jgi:hypothetical protein
MLKKKSLRLFETFEASLPKNQRHFPEDLNSESLTSLTLDRVSVSKLTVYLVHGM